MLPWIEKHPPCSKAGATTYSEDGSRLLVWQYFISVWCRWFKRIVPSLHKQRKCFRDNFLLRVLYGEIFRDLWLPTWVMRSTFNDSALHFASFSLQVKNSSGIFPFLVGKTWQESNEVLKRLLQPKSENKVCIAVLKPRKPLSYNYRWFMSYHNSDMAVT